MESTGAKKSYLSFPLNELQFVSVDVETTGLYPDKGDKIVEIAAVRFDQKRKSKEPMAIFSSIINPLRHIPDNTSELHGITDEIAQNAPPFSAIIPTFLHFINDDVLIGYNADFDMYFINKELQQNDRETLSNPIIDSLKVSKRFLLLPNYKLRDVAAHLNVEFPPGMLQHSALGDAMANGKVFCNLLNMVVRMGYEYAIDLFKLIGDKKQEQQEMIIKITDAIFREKKMKIRYHSLEHKVTDRMILPKKLEERNQEYFLVAYCYLQEQERTFALDRIIYWEILI